MTPEEVDEAGAGNTDTEAPESTRNHQEYKLVHGDKPGKISWNQQVEKMHPPAGQLVAGPGTRCLTFLVLISMIPVIPAEGTGI